MIEVGIAIRNLGDSLPRVELLEDHPDGARGLTTQTGMMTTINKNGDALLKYTFSEKRGRYSWQSAHVRISDPMGLFFSDLVIPAAAEMVIPPKQENIHRLQLRSRLTLHAPGLIPARHPGSGTDFWGVRPYHPGDALRWLAWRLNARHPGRFFTREFEQEEAADIGLILDARSETDLSAGEENLLEYSIYAAASLAEGFIHNGNRVSLLIWGKEIIRVFPGYGKKQLNRILHYLSGIRSSSPGKIIGLHHIPLEMFSKRALLVILSPLTRTDSAFFPRLRAASFQAMLISPDPYDFIHPTVPKDPEAQRAYYLARQERRIQLQTISGFSTQIIDWQVSQPLYPLIQNSLGHLRGHAETRIYYGA